MNRRERWAAAWFGPKGFASVVYSLLVLQSGMENATHLFHLLSVVIIASMTLHSSTDVWIGRWFTEKNGTGAGEDGNTRRDTSENVATSQAGICSAARMSG